MDAQKRIKKIRLELEKLRSRREELIDEVLGMVDRGEITRFQALRDSGVPNYQIYRKGGGKKK